MSDIACLLVGAGGPTTKRSEIQPGTCEKVVDGESRTPIIHDCRERPGSRTEPSNCDDFRDTGLRNRVQESRCPMRSSFLVTFLA